jgi:hypothetical protein
MKGCWVLGKKPQCLDKHVGGGNGFREHRGLLAKKWTT